MTMDQRTGVGRGVLIAMIVGALAVIVAVVLGIAYAFGQAADGAEGAAPPEQSASEVVEEYLKAIAAGDAETALSYLLTTPTDTTFLTDEVLAASNARAPIAAIDVAKPKKQDSSTIVTATYTVGGEEVSGDFYVDESEEGGWVITVGTTDLWIGANLAGLDLTLNGIPVDAEKVFIFPGAYEFATTTPYFTLTGPASFTWPGPGNPPSSSDIRGTLTDEGAALFRDAITPAVAACVASTTLVAGCGLDVPAVLQDGTEVVEGSITRTLTAEAQAILASYAPEESAENPLFVRGPIIGAVTTMADCRDKSGTTRCYIYGSGGSLRSPLVDFATAPPTVRWDG